MERKDGFKQMCGIRGVECEKTEEKQSAEIADIFDDILDHFFFAGIGADGLGDLLQGIDHGGVIPPAEFGADIRLAHAGNLPDDIHGGLAGIADLVIAALTADILGGDTVGAGDLIDNAVHRDRQRRLFGKNILDDVFGKHRGNGGAGKLIVGAETLDDALQLTDIVFELARDVGSDILRHREAETFRLAADDRHAGLKIGRLDICQKTPLKAGAEPVLQCFDLLGRAVAGEDDLLIAFVKRIKGVEELLLRTLFAGDELDIIDSKKIRLTVFFLKFGSAARTDGGDQLVGKLFALDIEQLIFGVVAPDLAADGIDEVRFAQTALPV